MALEVIGFTITAVEKVIQIGVLLRDQLRHYRLNADCASGIVARLKVIERSMRQNGAVIAAGDGVPSRSAVWEEALRKHEAEFRAFCAGMEEVEAGLASGKVRRFLHASGTAAKLEGLLGDVKKLQDELQTQGFFMAAVGEIVGEVGEAKDGLHRLEDGMGQLTDRVGQMNGQMEDFFEKIEARFEAPFMAVAGRNGGDDYTRGGNGREDYTRGGESGLAPDGRAGPVSPPPPLPLLPPPPALPATTVCRGMDFALDGSVDGGWRDFAARFADAAGKEPRMEGRQAANGWLETSAVSSRVSTGTGVGKEDEEMSEVERLEEKTRKFLFKLSHSSLFEEEKVMTARLVDTLWWGVWRVDVKDIVRLKDEEGQYMEIGDGGHGRVYKGTKMVRDIEGSVALDTPVAIKILHKEQSEPAGKGAFLREALLLREARHENVVSFMGAHWPEDGVVGGGPSLGTRAFLVTELMTGDLKDAMEAGVLASFDVSLWALVCIASALEFLHQKLILHQDLKVENILCNIVQGELLDVKLSDFGVSRMLRRASTRTRRGGTLDGAGTLPFMPPEAILASGTASCAVDVWSFGLLAAHVVLKEDPPTMKMEDLALHTAASKGTLAPMLQVWIRKLRSKTLLKLCLACIHTDPRCRPQVGEVKSRLVSLRKHGELAEEVHPARPVEMPQSVQSARTRQLPHPAQGSARPATSGGGKMEATDYYKTGCELFFGSSRYKQNITDGVKWLIAAAQRGHVDARAHLGYCYLTGVGVGGVDEQRGLRILYEAVEGGSCEAHNTIGHCFQFGVGYPRDEKRAVLHYQYAANANVASAMTNFGFCLFEGCGVEKDQRRAFDLFQKASKMQHPVALAHLGLCYQFGIGTAMNRSEAERLYRLGTEAEEQPPGRPPTFCCSAQYREDHAAHGVQLVATRVYRVPLSMRRGPAQIRLAAWFSMPSGKYKEFSELIRAAADAGDPIGIDFLPGASAYANLPAAYGGSSSPGAEAEESAYDMGKRMAEEAQERHKEIQRGMEEVYAKMRGSDKDSGDDGDKDSGDDSDSDSPEYLASLMAMLAMGDDSSSDAAPSGVKRAFARRLAKHASKRFTG